MVAEEEITDDHWMNSLRKTIREEKMFARSGDQLISLVANRGYMISYPEIFKDIYWKS